MVQGKPHPYDQKLLGAKKFLFNGNLCANTIDIKPAETTNQYRIVLTKKQLFQQNILKKKEFLNGVGRGVSSQTVGWFSPLLAVDLGRVCPFYDDRAPEMQELLILACVFT
jgi:hypothetical protein